MLPTPSWFFTILLMLLLYTVAIPGIILENLFKNRRTLSKRETELLAGTGRRP